MPLDLSKFSDSDYEAIKKDDIKGLSDAGYEMFKQQHQKYEQDLSLSANPTKIPDSADLVAQGNSPNAQPVSVRDQMASMDQGVGPQNIKDDPEENSIAGAVGAAIPLSATLATPTGSAAIGTGASAIGSLLKYFGKGTALGAGASTVNRLLK